MRAPIADDLAIDTRKLVEHYVAKSFAYHRPVSFDDSLQRSHHPVRGRDSMLAMLRQSSSLGSSRLSSFEFFPGHEVIKTTVRFLGVTRVDNHCTFKLHVDTGREQFELQKRYSQFRKLRQQLLLNGKVTRTAVEKGHKGQCLSSACQQLAQQLGSLKFPQRKMKFKLHRHDDVKTARKRQAQLQDFVELMLATYRTAPKRQVRCCVNSQCRVFNSIRSFFSIKDLSDWKSTSQSTMSSDKVSILNTPPSLEILDTPLFSTSNPSPVSSIATGNGLSESPILRTKSLVCLEELYTITED